MPTLEYSGGNVETDADGFLIDGDDWTPELAEAMANRAGVGPLTERHWRVLTRCREEAARGGCPRGLDRMVEVTGVTAADLHRLFPGDPERLTAKIAGLPDPHADD